MKNITILEAIIPDIVHYSMVNYIKYVSKR